jgi:pyridoxal biosynthesis lyase PdxS
LGHSYAIPLSKIKQSSLIKSLRDSVSIPVLRKVLGHSYAIPLSKIKQSSLIKSLRDSVSIPVLRKVYFIKLESILKYGIIF